MPACIPMMSGHYRKSMQRTLRAHPVTVAVYLFFMLVLAGFCQPVLAAALLEAEGHIRISRIDVSTDVDADLRARTETLIEREALTERGSVLASNYVMAYDKELEQLEIVDAYTLKPDGSKIRPEPGGVKRHSALTVGGETASWPETEWLQVSFPEVKQGDKTVIRILQRTRALPLDGWFSIFDFLSPDYAYDSYRFRLSAPAGFALRVVGDALVLQHEEINGKQVWTIQGATPAMGVDAHAVDTLTVWPHIVGSSLSSHVQMVEAYADKNSARTKVSAEALKLVDRLTWGMKDPHAMAQVIYNWVRDNIRYVDISLGTGGWLAHNVDWILTNRYGDSKDHALLLQVLLRAAGVQAVPVLINTGEQYTLPELPSRYSFNHVMVYLPVLELFADSTSADTPFGELPGFDLDKPVAIALPKGGQMFHTPVTTAEKNTLTSRARWKIEANGNATLDLQIDGSGPRAADLQDRLQQLRARGGLQVVRQILENSGFRGRGTIQYGKLQQGQWAQPVHLQMEMQGMLPEPHGGVINPNPPLAALPVSIRSQYDFVAMARSYSQRCMPVRVREEFEMQFSPAFTLSRVPDNVALDSEAGVRFTAEYHMSANTLTGVRTLVLSQARHVCTPQDYARRKPVFDQITRQLKSTLLYQQ